MNDTNTITAVIVAGGMGTRLGKPIPKAFVPLAGVPLFLYSLNVFDANHSVSDCVLVVPIDFVDEVHALLSDYRFKKKTTVVPGGKERWQSVSQGLMHVPQSCDWVLVHDAARPFVTDKVIQALLEKKDSYKGIITATPVVDTIRMFIDDHCTNTVDRNQLMRVGTPQLFLKSALCDALAHAPSMVQPPTDEAMLLEQCGFIIGFAWGDSRNFKITTPYDLDIAEALIQHGTYVQPFNRR